MAGGDGVTLPGEPIRGAEHVYKDRGLVWKNGPNALGMTWHDEVSPRFTCFHKLRMCLCILDSFCFIHGAVRVLFLPSPSLYVTFKSPYHGRRARASRWIGARSNSPSVKLFASANSCQLLAHRSTDFHFVHTIYKGPPKQDTPLWLDMAKL